MNIAFARRGYSPTGGAENYLRRLGSGLVETGHAVELFTTAKWPAHQWPYGKRTTLHATSPIGFADELERVRRNAECDLLVSLERVWRCDFYRAGDGVHRAWLERRAKTSGPLRRLAAKLNRKHSDLLRLEEALFQKRGAGRVIANSRMVKDEIVKFYDYPADQIDLVYTGVPLELFSDVHKYRHEKRQMLNLSEANVALLFVGSGWERKGLRETIDAIEQCKDSRLRLLVAGRGNERRFNSDAAKFFGVVQDMPSLYAAADIFILPTYYDPFSNACLEALASGLPVITTRDNGFSEVFQDGVHGSILDRADNITALRDAIKAWSDAARRNNARPAILQRASEFDISKNVEQTLALLFQVAAKAAFVSGKIRNT